jgi:glycerol-3-phosphate dehydrogenase
LELEPCTTDKIPLCGNDFKKFKHVKKYIGKVQEQLQDDGFAKYDAWYLVTTYGKQTESILELYAKIKGDKSKERMIRAEVQFAIAHEMALNPLDFLIRRTGRLYFDIDSVRKYKDPVFDEFHKAYNYSAEEMEAFSKELDAQLKEHSDFSLERD